MATIITAISVATKSAKLMRLTALPATDTVCCCPIMFLLMVEGRRWDSLLASARLPFTL